MMSLDAQASFLEHFSVGEVLIATLMEDTPSALLQIAPIWPSNDPSAMQSWLAGSMPKPGNPPSARSGTPAMAWGGLLTLGPVVE
jgi:hypothetical protein